MKAEAQQGDTAEQNRSAVTDWCEAVAQDLQQLAVLHDRELDETTVCALKTVDFPRNLGFPVQDEISQSTLSDPFKQPLQFFTAAMTGLPQAIDSGTLDRLAVDYADIYLNHTLHASPYESVWLDEDNLTQQEPMFKIRNWYRRYGVETENWRVRSDDHLVLQIQFIALLLDPHSVSAEIATEAERVADAARFMDEHLLLWIKDFRDLVVKRSSTDFYASLAVLTVAYLDQLRNALAELTGIERMSDEQIVKKRNPQQAALEQPVTFMPGVAESW